jgi:hypothetical protein
LGHLHVLFISFVIPIGIQLLLVVQELMLEAEELGEGLSDEEKQIASVA